MHTLKIIWAGLVIAVWLYLVYDQFMRYHRKGKSN
jgi:hypothetical protein